MNSAWVLTINQLLHNMNLPKKEESRTQQLAAKNLWTVGNCCSVARQQRLGAERRKPSSYFFTSCLCPVFLFYDRLPAALMCLTCVQVSPPPSCIGSLSPLSFLRACQPTLLFRSRSFCTTCLVRPSNNFIITQSQYEFHHGIPILFYTISHDCSCKSR